MLNKTIRFVLGFCFLIGLASCSGSSIPTDFDQPPGEGALPPPGSVAGGNGSGTKAASDAGKHTSTTGEKLPGDPAAKGVDDAADIDPQGFFQNKEEFDSFPTDMKTQIQKSYAGVNSQDENIASTLFGPVNVMIVKATGKVQEDGVPLNCKHDDDKFLCLDDPVDQSTVVADRVDISGAVDMCHVGLFIPPNVKVDLKNPPHIPVVDVFVFGQSRGTRVASDSIIRLNELSISGDCETGKAIGNFNTSVALGGPGTYSVLVSAWRLGNKSIDLKTRARTVISAEAPHIEFLRLLPPQTDDKDNPGNVIASDPRAEVSSGDTVSMSYARMLVKLTSVGTENVGVKFENFADAQFTKRRYEISGASTFGSENGGFPTQLANLALYPGYNYLRATALNSKIPVLNPSHVDAFLINRSPSLTIKLLGDDAQFLEDGKVIEGGDVNLHFCLTDLPGADEAFAGQCIQTDDTSHLTVQFNGVKQDNNTSLGFNASTGEYQARLWNPQTGNNIFTISVEKPGLVSSTQVGTFGYGRINKIIDKGVVVQGEESFSKTQTLSLEINKDIFLSDDGIKKMLKTYLTKSDFAETIRKSFMKYNSTAPTNCWEYGPNPSTDSGDTAVEFLDDGFKIDRINIDELRPRNDVLALIATISGFHAKVNLRGLNAPHVMYGDTEVGYIPLVVDINKMVIKVGIKFPKYNGVSYLNIIPIDQLDPSNPDVISIEGDQGLNLFVQIDPTANGFANGLANMEKERGTVAKQFRETLNRTILCGIENGINPPQNFDIQHPPITGMGRWIGDLQHVINYDPKNPFRIPINPDLGLGKPFGIDIAYDLLRGDITFSENGIRISNVPLRINTGSDILTKIVNNLSDNLKKKVIGSLSALSQAPSPNVPLLDPADSHHQLGISISEDAINQMLFAANMTGVLDINIDPNFYAAGTKQEIGFINMATPVWKDMFGSAITVDANGDGLANDGEDPVQLRIKTDKTLAPVLHFLNPTEVQEIAKLARDNRNMDDPNDQGKELNTDYNKFPELRYFRLSVANLEIAVYPATAKPEDYKPYCAIEVSDTRTYQAAVPPIDITNYESINRERYGCRQDFTWVIPATEPTCPAQKGFKEEKKPFLIPTKSYTAADAQPLARFKVNLIVYGALQGTYREIQFKDLYLTPEKAVPKNFLRIHILPNHLTKVPLLYTKFKMVENHTSVPDAALVNTLQNTLIPMALAQEDCKRMNEIRISMPERFPDVSTSGGGLADTFKDLGIHHVSLGKIADKLIKLTTDPQAHALKALVHLGICYMGSTDQDDCKLTEPSTIPWSSYGKTSLGQGANTINGIINPFPSQVIIKQPVSSQVINKQQPKNWNWQP